MSARIYVTTPIYYVSDVPHLGHAYTTIVTDAVARYHRLCGHDTRFLTGTDDHGQKIERMAASKNQTPKHYADGIADSYKACWRTLGIANDDFIRTTDADHEAMVQELWGRLVSRGFIELRPYTGWYCVPCEQFYPDKELDDGKCPVHKRPVERVEEENYFFKLSQFQKPLQDFYDRVLRDTGRPFVEPITRMNEVRAFVDAGLDDLSVSRTNFSWGVGVPNDPRHVIYVWLDALTNYFSATRRPSLNGFWDDDVNIVHFMGKEITRFHAVYWPAFLMAAGLRPPSKIIAHGWWTVDGEKMSKTRGNVVDPNALARDIGADAFRYFVLREVPLGSDGDFSHERLIERYNAELANDLGNLLNRTLGMVAKYLPSGLVRKPSISTTSIADESMETAVRLGLVRKPSISTPDPMSTKPTWTSATMAMQSLFNPKAADPDDDLAQSAREVSTEVSNALEGFDISGALDLIWLLVRRANGYIDRCAPWKQTVERQEAILWNVLEACRVIGHLVSPFMPERAVELLRQVGAPEKVHLAKFGDGPSELKPAKAAPLFPRIDEDRKKELLAKWAPPAAATQQSPSTNAAIDPAATQQKALVSFDDFARLDLRVGEIVSAERVPKKDKLLKLSVDLGAEKRQVVAGIGAAYAPESLVGTRVIFLANLKPAKIGGVLSEGMILAAGDAEIVALSALDRTCPPGTKVR